MKCPKCSSGIPEGSLYCPGCMQEVKWVADYESVETMMARNKIREEEDLETELPKLHARNSFPKLSWYFTVFCVILLIICGCISILIKGNKAENYYQNAQTALEKEDYVHAVTLAKAALNLTPEDPDIMLVYVKALMGGSDAYSEGIVKTLEEYLGRCEGNEALYRILLEQYYMKQQKVKIRRTLGQMPESLKEAFTSYYAETPVFSVAEGRYSDKISVEITNASEETYYTVDGTVPTSRTNHYTGPICLHNGTTVLKAVTFNEEGFSSEVASAEYVVYAGIPDAPSVSPASGDYYRETYITVEVPDGCECFYSFDQDSTDDMVLYTGPVQMPVGRHSFFAVLRGTSEVFGEMTVMEYELEYE